MAYGDALAKASGRTKALDPDASIESDEKVYSEQKEAVAREAASALGIDPDTIDARAFCDALKKLIELE